MEPPLAAAPPEPDDGRNWGRYVAGAVFLAPALFVLGVWVVYPVVYTVLRSFFGQSGYLGTWVGLDNYKRLFTTSTLRTAIKNNAIWVAVVPAFVTSIGLLFAVLHREDQMEGRLQDGRLPADGDLRIRDRRHLADHVPAGPESRRRQRTDAQSSRTCSTSPACSRRRSLPHPGCSRRARAGRWCCNGRCTREASRCSASPGSRRPTCRRPRCRRCSRAAKPGTIVGTVWRDFKPGGGKVGVVEKGELGLPGVTVELRSAAGKTVQSTTSQRRRIVRLRGRLSRDATGRRSARRPSRSRLPATPGSGRS